MPNHELLPQRHIFCTEIKILNSESHDLGLLIPAWYINKFTIIDFTIYTQLFLVKLKSVVDGPILHSKSVVDGPILHSKSVVDGSFQYGILIKLPSYFAKNTNFCFTV